MAILVIGSLCCLRETFNSLSGYDASDVKNSHG